MKRLIIGLALVMLLLVPVSCAKAPVAPMPPSPEEGVSMPSVVFKGEGEYQAETTETTQERMIVRTGDMSLVVKDITQACDDIARLAVRFDGYVVSSQISG